MSQCQVAGCLGTASATTGQCSVCSVPIECPTLGCKNVPVVLAVGCNWCPNCNRPTSARVPTQAVAHALQAHGVDWNGAQARRFAGTYVGTAFGTHTLTGGDTLALLSQHLAVLGRKRIARILNAAIDLYNWAVTDITRAGTRANLRSQNRLWFGQGVVPAKAAVRIAVKRIILGRLGANAGTSCERSASTR